MTFEQTPEWLRDRWNAVDRYVDDTLGLSDSALLAALADSETAGLPSIQVSSSQGRFLQILSQSIGAKQVLEIGTLAGYSTICLARALPKGGRVISLEIDAKHAAVAGANIARAGLAELVDIRLGRALDTLPRLATEGRPPFDLVFIDADKENIPEYFTWAMRLTHRGSVIIVDNVVRKGEVVDSTSEDASVRGVRRFMEMLSAETRISATVIQTVGVKGYDGFALALVTGV